MRIQIVVVVVGVAIGKLLDPHLDWRLLLSLQTVPAALQAALIAYLFMLAAFVSFAVLFFTAPIWILAEVLDWRRCRRERAECRSLDRRTSTSRR